MFWERFSSLCATIGKKPNPVAAELGFSSGVVTSWKNGTVPKMATIEKLAKYFNVTVDYFFTEDKQDFLNDDEKRLIELYRSLSVDGKAIVLSTAVQGSRREKTENESDRLGKVEAGA